MPKERARAGRRSAGSCVAATEEPDGSRRVRRGAAARCDLTSARSHGTRSTPTNSGGTPSRRRPEERHCPREIARPDVDSMELSQRSPTMSALADVAAGRCQRTSSERFRRRAREITSPRAQQDPMHRRPRRQPLRRSRAAHQLMQDPLRAPPRVIAPQVTHARLQLRRRLIRIRPRPLRPIRQPRQAATSIARQPRMHRLARHTDLRGHLADLRAVQHRHHRPIPLLDNRQRHQRQSRPPARERESRSRPAASSSPETPASSRSRDRTHPDPSSCQVPADA